MKAYRFFAAFFLLTLTALPVSSQFQPADELGRYPKCTLGYDCYKLRADEDLKQIERQEEVEEIEDVEVNNEKFEEVIRNSEQPGLNKKGP